MILKKLFSGLKKTRDKLKSGLGSLFRLGRKLDDEFIEELEEVLYSSDMGSTTVKIIETVREAYKKREVTTPEEVYAFLKARLRDLMSGTGSELARAASGPTVVLVVGVNGSGKTTSIAKLAHILQQDGHSVLLAASDTFRAAAVAQLTLWAERIGVGIVKGSSGADPASVAYDAARRAVAESIDYLIVDTAGRLHTQVNLMRELEKVQRVTAKQIAGAPHEVLLVLDATTGQNAVAQALEFKKVVNVTGLFLAKLDGTAKGGAVVAIRDRVDIPVKFVGVGETPDAVERFQAAEFVDALFE
ncbi:MAG: signal recognition particle-docking protein FtsY [Planctomycetota bacterium]